jgi:hypothetical protein
VMELELRIQLGKRARGEGYNSLGDAVPGMLQRAGLIDIAVALNDRANPLLPPYPSRAERALLEDLEDRERRDQWGWPRDLAERHFHAGGGTAEGFEAGWAATRARRSRVLAGIRAGTYTEAGGSAHFLITGRRPA